MKREDLKQIWQMFLTYSKRNDSLSGGIEGLLSGSVISDYDEQKSVIEISPPDETGYNYMRNNIEDCMSMVSDYFRKFHGIENIEIRSPAPAGEDGKGRGSEQVLRPAANGKRDVFIGSLNSRYTFESFVVGESNNLAHAAALGSARGPGINNPLYIRGAPGLGKTHLMNAIGNKLLEGKPDKKICCLSSEGFTNLVVDYISKKSTEEMRRKLRKGCDILMIDDIQFIQGKERTKEEFFHTFNELHDAGKQIVLTSDKEPQEMLDFEERMISRFLWGLIVEIRPPDIETRAAIVRKKAEERNVEIPQGVVDIICEKVRNNVRELEGILTQLVVFAETAGKPIDIRTALEVLRSNSVSPQRGNGGIGGGLSTQLIKATVEGVFNLKRGQLESPERTKTVVLARQIAMHLARKHLDMPYLSIGNEFGKRDHSTVMHAVSKIEAAIEREEEIVTSGIKEVEDRMKYG